jgi:hypothetical protein
MLWMMVAAYVLSRPGIIEQYMKVEVTLVDRLSDPTRIS